MPYNVYKSISKGWYSQNDQFTGETDQCPLCGQGAGRAPEDGRGETESQAGGGAQCRDAGEGGDETGFGARSVGRPTPTRLPCHAGQRSLSLIYSMRWRDICFAVSVTVHVPHNSA